MVHLESISKTIHCILLKYFWGTLYHSSICCCVFPLIHHQSSSAVCRSIGILAKQHSFPYWNRVLVWNNPIPSSNIGERVRYWSRWQMFGGHPHQTESVSTQLGMSAGCACCVLVWPLVHTLYIIQSTTLDCIVDQWLAIWWWGQAIPRCVRYWILQVCMSLSKIWGCGGKVRGAISEIPYADQEWMDMLQVDVDFY